ncbi:hypothetical protein C7271_21415 [filamentous cyanobacterium CCP5]|nr:hypothetical protein C7271_21415 [filamentous cyanobacterium CCP5]
MHKNISSDQLITASSHPESSEALIFESSIPQEIFNAIEIGEFSISFLAYGGVAILGIWAATALIKALTDLVKACQD